MKNQLLKNIYYGYEFDRSESGTRDLVDFFKFDSFASIEIDWVTLRKQVEAFYFCQHSGVFGGQITLGDGYLVQASCGT